MLSGWDRYEERVRELVVSAETSSAEVIEGEPGWQPSGRPLPAKVRAAAAEVTETPAVLWDVDELRCHGRRLADVFGSRGIGLNLAMKACSTPGAVAPLAELGLGCDVASPFELDIARQAGFTEISACGPAFRPEHLPALARSHSYVDTVSTGQARDFLRAPGVRRLGLRLRVPMPSSLLSPTTRGMDSRFGVSLTPDVLAELRAAPVPIRRLRVHTGESTSRNLAFRAGFALAAAELFDEVETINLGGGFLRLSRSPGELERTLSLLEPLLAGSGGRYRFTVEPGGALMVDHAYLVTEVLEVDEHPTRGRMITVDASAWNCAPWSKMSFHAPDPDEEPGDATVVGPSLYEFDAFSRSSGPDRHRVPVGRCRPGDRLVGTSFGAYTLTNGRSFHGLPLPAEHALTGDETRLLHGPRFFAERAG